MARRIWLFILAASLVSSSELPCSPGFGNCLAAISLNSGSAPVGSSIQNLTLFSEDRFIPNLVFSSPLVRDSAIPLVVQQQDQDQDQGPGRIGHAPHKSLYNPELTGPSPVQFLHGIASGDPLQTSVILWTKITIGLASASPIRVHLQIAADANADLTRLLPTPAEPIRNLFTHTSHQVDYIVKVDVKDLMPNQAYYYQFHVYDAFGARHSSWIGRTTTLPLPDDESLESLRLAVVSCSNLPAGFFNAYRNIASRKDIDLVVHLGDYIYEYMNGQYGDGTALGRIPLPDHDLVTVQDYRARHAQYKLDPDLQAAHRLVPWIVVWDDHEFADNAWLHGADNHPQTAGDWHERVGAAVRAYFEYLPIRPQVQTEENRIYRNFQYGKLLDLIMLDTRIVGREETDLKLAEVVQAENRTILGEIQENWFLSQLKQSSDRGARWRFVGQQVVFSTTYLVHDYANYDAWDGYPANRKRILNFVQNEGIDNLVVLTGDVHASWVYDIALDPFNSSSYDPKTGAGAIGVEFVSPSVTSNTPLDHPSKVPLRYAPVESYMEWRNPHLKYTDLRRHGYMLLHADRDRVSCEYWYTPILERTDRQVLGARFETLSGSGRITSQRRFSYPWSSL